jgi:hypothetical protein
MVRQSISCVPAVALLLLALGAVQSVSAGCSGFSLSSRRLLQSSADASAVAVDNISGQTTNQTASASAEASAVATSVVPLPRKFVSCLARLSQD